MQMKAVIASLSQRDTTTIGGPTTVRFGAPSSVKVRCRDNLFKTPRVASPGLWLIPPIIGSLRNGRKEFSHFTTRGSHHDSVSKALQHHCALNHVLNALATHPSLLRPGHRCQVTQQELSRFRLPRTRHAADEDTLVFLALQQRPDTRPTNSSRQFRDP